MLLVQNNYVELDDCATKNFNILAI